MNKVILNKITTLCRSRVWIGMKVLRPNSIILGARKLWWIFPIKQKFDTTAAFLDNPKCSILSNLTIFLTVFSETSRCTMVKKLSPNFCLVLNIFTIKKSCRGIKFLFNWKNSPWFSGAYNDWIGLQDFHALSDLRSTQSEQTSQNFKADVIYCLKNV